MMKKKRQMNERTKKKIKPHKNKIYGNDMEKFIFDFGVVICNGFGFLKKAWKWSIKW